MMTRKKMAIFGIRDDISREGKGNRNEIAGLRFCLEGAETR